MRVSCHTILDNYPQNKGTVVTLEKTHRVKRKRILMNILRKDRFLMNKKKVIYNYNIEQSNQLIKKGMFPIGCGINPKSGGFFLVFSGTPGYFNTLDLIALENKQKQYMQE